MEYINLNFIGSIFWLEENNLICLLFSDVKRTTFSILVVLVLAAIFISCKDSLPAYVQPTNILEIRFNSIDTNLVTYTGMLTNTPVFSYARISPFPIFNPDHTPFGPGTTPYNFIIEVENVYEETIQTAAAVQGTLVISLLSNPDVRATIPIDKTSLQAYNSSTVYDPATNIITLNPHQHLYLRVTWDYLLDELGWVHNVASEYVDSPRDETTLNRDHSPVGFRVSVRTQIIKNTEYLTADSSFVMKLKGVLKFK